MSGEAEARRALSTLRRAKDILSPESRGQR